LGESPMPRAYSSIWVEIRWVIARTTRSASRVSPGARLRQSLHPSDAFNSAMHAAHRDTETRRAGTCAGVRPVVARQRRRA
jgi:hypothetical protein